MLRYSSGEYDKDSAAAHYESHGRSHFPILTTWKSVLQQCCDDERIDEAFDDLVRARHRSVAYAYHYLRCGIYVRIRDGKVVRFAPFANPDFTNDWTRHDATFEEGSLIRHTERKQKTERYDPVPDVSRWYCNGSILCNQWDPEKPWGQMYLAHLKCMLDDAFQEGDDADFMLNKRDYPQLRRSKAGRLLNPYGFMHDREVPERFQGEHLRFLSFYGDSSVFDDRLIPTTDDVEIATGDLFPPAFADIRSAPKLEAHRVPWSEKVDTAFFRGGATGGGVTIEDNTRLHLASLHDGDLLDAGIVAWNARDKKLRGKPITWIRPERLPFGLSSFVPVAEQQRFKYVVYVDGHCAASRYGSMMKLDALILRVESRDDVPGDLWLSKHLKGGKVKGKRASGIRDADHLIVKSDLSNVLDTIRWARGHDEQVQRIVARCHVRAAELLTWESITRCVRHAALC